jgi:peptidoglycan hydrolase-like protein with peptidoglycan-binding domain
MWSRIFVIILLAIALTGCATARKNKDTAGSTSSDLQMRVNDLEHQVQAKDEEIRSLEDELAKLKVSTKDETTKAIDVSSVKVTPKGIQTALKSAGMYDGDIDGRIGKKTKDAIKEFQKANGLKADGKVGKQTWAKMLKYLEQ